jgi:attachment p12 family protein
MNWQAFIVVACVVFAVAYLVRDIWRTWRPKTDGCGGCGCARSRADDDERSQSRRPLPTNPPGH